MRIMMLPQFYPPIIGGEERFAQDLSTALARRGHAVSVVTLWQPGLPESETGPEGVRVHRVRGFTQGLRWLYADEGRRLATPYPDPGVVRRLRAIVDAERPDVLHGHNWMIYSCFPLRRGRGPRIVWTLGDHSLVCAKKKLIWHRGGTCPGPSLTRCIPCASDHYGAAKGVPTVLGNMAMAALGRRLVDRFLPVSASVAEACGLPGSGVPFEVVPNFVPDSAGDPGAAAADPPSGLPDGEFLLYVGALGHYKGVDALIAAYRLLGDAPPLVLIGYETLEYPVATTDLPPGVRVLKNQGHEAVMAAWRRASVGLVPSTWDEPFGIVALEAMATGTPVVASRIGGLTDIVEDGVTGVLVPPGDVQALAAAMRRLVDDPALRGRMGERGRERVGRFRERVVVPRFERVYEDVLAGRPPAPPSQPVGGAPDSALNSLPA
jgi:glycosyltransferase involved in cell wall biosynthesis